MKYWTRLWEPWRQASAAVAAAFLCGAAVTRGADNPVGNNPSAGAATSKSADIAALLGPLATDLTMALSMDAPENGSIVFSQIPLTARFSGPVQFSTSDGRHYADFSSPGAVLQFSKPGLRYGPAYTLSSWIRLPEPAETAVIWRANTDSALTLWRDQFTCLRQDDQEPYASYDKTLTGWHHVAVTCDGRRLIFYFDGQRKGTIAYAIGGDLYALGNQRNPDGRGCAGLDDVLIFDRELTKEEIARVMPVRLPVWPVQGATEGPIAAAPNQTPAPATPSAESSDNATVQKAMAPANVAPLAQMPAAADVAKLARESLITLTGAKGSGTGFVANFAGTNCILTTASVPAAARGIGLQTPDGKKLTAGEAMAAVGHDIFRIAYEPTGKPFEILPSVEKNAAPGDPVVVPGLLANGASNAVGGKILGFGPNYVEVDAPFLAENNGSPIIHLKTGRVIGVASYLTLQKHDTATPTTVIHRIGYRLDTVNTWQTVNWIFYFAQATELQNIRKLTGDLDALRLDLVKNHRPTPGLNVNPAFQSLIEAWASSPGIRSGSPEAVAKDQEFITSLKTVSLQDVTSEKRRATYDYFQRELAAQQLAREEIAANLEKAIREARKAP